MTSTISELSEDMPRRTAHLTQLEVREKQSSPRARVSERGGPTKIPPHGLPRRFATRKDDKKRGTLYIRRATYVMLTKLPLTTGA